MEKNYETRELDNNQQKMLDYFPPILINPNLSASF